MITLTYWAYGIYKKKPYIQMGRYSVLWNDAFKVYTSISIKTD